MLDYHASTNVAKCVIYQPDGLWAAVVAERLSFDRDTSLTLGRAVAGLKLLLVGGDLLTKRALRRIT